MLCFLLACTKLNNELPQELSASESELRLKIADGEKVVEKKSDEIMKQRQLLEEAAVKVESGTYF